MMGENDNALKWPVKYKCTITLLNQLRDEGHHTMIMDFQEGQNRVRGGDISASGYGELFFIPHNKLDLQEEEQCQYLKDDSLFFRVRVELIPAVRPWLVPTLLS